jgi:hypothetical protein
MNPSMGIGFRASPKAGALRSVAADEFLRPRLDRLRRAEHRRRNDLLLFSSTSSCAWRAQRGVRMRELVLRFGSRSTSM